MKVFLINPPYCHEEQGGALEPIGLCYLASVARLAGHDVRIHDLCDTHHADLPRFFAEMDAFDPEVVGITGMSSNYMAGLKVARAVKARYGCTTVFGGWHVSGRPQTVLEAAIDYVVIGEGEDTFVELLRFLSSGKPQRCEIRGLAYEEDGHVQINRPRERMKSLDLLPPPDRSELPVHRYRHPMLMNVPVSRMKTLSLQGSRGCPYKCTFCQTPAIWGNLWRHRDAASVADEIEHLIEAHQINSLFFRDEEFTLNRTWVLDVARELTRRGIPKVLQWGSFCRLDDIDRELVETLKEAGYCYGFVGIEGGTAGARDRIRKHFKQEEAERALQLFHEYDITSHAGWIIGFPWDTPEGLEEQFDWLRTLPIDLLAMSYAMPFDGTPFGEEMKATGMLLSEDTDRISLKRPVLRTPHIGTEELVRIRASFVRRFYLRPRHLARMVRRLYLQPQRFRIFGEIVWQFGKTAYFGPRGLSDFSIPDSLYKSPSREDPGGEIRRESAAA